MDYLIGRKYCFISSRHTSVLFLLCKGKPEIYWIHFTGNECENILKQYDIKNCYIGERLYLKLLFQDIITELQLKKYLMKTLYCIIFIFSYALFIVPFIVSPDLWIMIFPLTGYYLN